MHRSVARLIIPVLTFSLLVACSNDSGGDGNGQASAEASDEAAAPATYADGLCSAIASYQTDLQAENSAFQEQLSGGTPGPAETKDALTSFLGTAADRTEQLIDDVEALGTPDVDNGAEVRSAFVNGFQKVVDLFNAAKADVEKLSIDDPEALAAGFTEAGTKLQEAGTEIGASFDDLSSPELDAAAAEAASCSGLI